MSSIDGTRLYIYIKDRLSKYRYLKEIAFLPTNLRPNKKVGIIWK